MMKVQANEEKKVGRERWWWVVGKVVQIGKHKRRETANHSKHDVGLENQK